MAGLWEPRLWVLVTDGERARVMMADLESGSFRTILRLGALEPPHCPPPLRDAPFEGARTAFATDLARRLDHEAAAGTYDHLVLFAPPQVLHDIQDALGPDAQARVIGSVAKPCAGLDDDEVSRHLTQWGPATAAA